MGAVDNWPREHAVLHTTTGAYDPNANSLVEESVSRRASRPVGKCFDGTVFSHHTTPPDMNPQNFNGVVC